MLGVLHPTRRENKGTNLGRKHLELRERRRSSTVQYTTRFEIVDQSIHNRDLKSRHLELSERWRSSTVQYTTRFEIADQSMHNREMKSRQNPIQVEQRPDVFSV